MKSKVLFSLLTLDFDSPKSSEAIRRNLLLRTCLSPSKAGVFPVIFRQSAAASPGQFEAFCSRGTFRRAAASSLDTSFFNFRFFFNSDLDANGSSSFFSVYWSVVPKILYMMILSQSKQNKILFIGVVQVHPGHFRCKWLVWQLRDTRVKVCLATSTADEQVKNHCQLVRTRRDESEATIVT